MGAMKQIHLKRVLGVPLSQTLRAFAGLEPWPLSKEEKAELRAAKAAERAALKEAAAEAKAEREAIQWVESRADLVREFGEPGPPQGRTGFYRCNGGGEGAYFWVGSGPFPDYRPPGLAWSRAWPQPKPADVPWADEAPPPPPEPEPIPETNDKLEQGRFAW